MKKNIICAAITILLTTTTLNAQDNWVNQNPPANPGIMLEHEISYIGDDKILLFGGLIAAGVSNQTWLYDKSDNNWTLLTPATQPSPRFAHSMCYLGDDKVLLFGGYDWSVAFGDTWIFDLSDNTWTLKNPVSSPSPRYHFGMAAIGTDQVVAFSGDGAGADTWVYDLSDNNWTLKSPLTNPAAQSSMAMTRIGTDEALLLGHNGTNGTADDTWIYNITHNSWIMISTGTNPPARFEHTMASLNANGAFVFGGRDFIGGGALGDTWIFDRLSDSWTMLSPSTNPSARSNYGLTSISNNDVILYGGLCDCPGSGFFSNETWIYTSSAVTCNLTVSAGTDESLYFGYAPDQCVTKTATVTNSTAPLIYSWTLDRALLPGETMTGAATSSVTICLLDTAELCLTVTDANGCTATDCATIFAEDVRCFAGNSQNQKIKVCHNGNSICVSTDAVAAHIAHGDYVGACTGNVSAQSELNVEQSSKEGFTVFPNPSNSSFNLRINNDANENSTMKVYDATGKLIEQRNKLAPGAMITFGNNYCKGIYLVTIFGQTERRTLKLLKR